MLMASCTELELPSEPTLRLPVEIVAKDCVNGTLMPKHKFASPSKTNYTEVNHVFVDQGHFYRLDDDIKMIPYDTDITIYPKTKVNITINTYVFKQLKPCLKCYIRKNISIPFRY